MKRERVKPPAEDADSVPPSASSLQIEIQSGVLRDIRQHARSSMSAEICGVLIGVVKGGTTFVGACIQGNEARQGGSHVTFTQDTWSHIYQVKDSKYPDKRIVGWYHSHPGFGIFLSEHDTFIHRNFFSDPSQIAWVYDPHSDEEGCFAWDGDDLRRVTQIGFRDTAAGSEPAEAQSETESSTTFSGNTLGAVEAVSQPSRNRWLRFTLLFLSHCLVLLLGFGAGYVLSPQVIVIRDKALSSRPVISPHKLQPTPDTSLEKSQTK